MLDIALQIRMLEVCESSFDEIRNFEYNCLGEVRILGALKHSCIVQMYGHRISSEWIPSEDGKPKRRLLRSAIFLENVKGGSLKVTRLLACVMLPFLYMIVFLILCFYLVCCRAMWTS